MRKVLLTILLIFTCSISFAQTTNVQRVLIEPLSSGISFNTITFAARGATGWVTAPTVAMYGRKRVIIQNNSSSDNIYLTGVSGSTAYGTLGFGKVASFGAANMLHIYVSANTACSCDVWEIR